MSVSAKISTEEFGLMRELIEKASGISLGDAKEYLVEGRLRPLLREAGCATFKEFHAKALDRRSGWLDRIIDAMTTNETLWFRDKNPFIILREKILPDLISRVKGRKIRIWSAGCSTGQEPYSIAITLLEYCKTKGGCGPQNFEILGTDISPSALFLAVSGRYEGLAISRGMDAALFPTYFTREGKVQVVNPEVRALVKFRQLNLQDSFAALGRFDIIFCRNVAIYFSDTFKRELFAKFHRSLNPKGYFFLGSAENLRGFSEAFEPLQHHNSLYYQAK